MQNRISELKEKAAGIRRKVLDMIAGAGKGHIGGAFSSADILVTLFYGGILRIDPCKKDWDGRDRFILSKGHSCAVLYAILSDMGFFTEEQLLNYQKEGYILGGHPHRGIPGIEADTGSLGHGLGIGAGIALGAKMDKKDFVTVVLLGDGECCEGSVWEAASFASYHRLNNLVGIVDKNGLCVTDYLKDCSPTDTLEQRWQACGWDVISADGHKFERLLKAFGDIHERKSSRPLMVIANTIKGKGVSFMEGELSWHHGVPKGEELEKARKELTNLQR